MTEEESLNMPFDDEFNANPVANTAPVPAVPRGAVVAFIRGGIYCATAQEIDAVYSQYYSAAGQRIRRAMFDAIGDDKETREFYEGATIFECALILANATSELRDYV